jgi:hypothetical protein
MVNGNLQVVLWLVMTGIVQCSHAVALLFCFRFRNFSWAMPVLILGLLGRISTGFVSLAHYVKILSGNGFGAVPSAFESIVLPAANFVNFAGTILVDLGLVLLLVDVSRQFQFWREAAGAADPQGDE